MTSKNVGQISADELVVIMDAVAKVTSERDELRAEIKREKQWATRVINRQNAEIERLRADYNAAYKNYVAQRDENERLRARLNAAEQLIEVVRAREIGTAGGVGAAFEAYDALARDTE